VDATHSFIRYYVGRWGSGEDTNHGDNIPNKLKEGVGPLAKAEVGEEVQKRKKRIIEGKLQKVE